jgi:hypothetical protein
MLVIAVKTDQRSPSAVGRDNATKTGMPLLLVEGLVHMVNANVRFRLVVMLVTMVNAMVRWPLEQAHKMVTGGLMLLLLEHVLDIMVRIHLR